VPPHCPLCGEEIRGDAEHCPMCGCSIQLINLKAQVKLLEGAIEGWRSVNEQKTSIISEMQGVLERVVSLMTGSDYICPLCGNDLRPKKDCKHCEIDHEGGECYHDGKHEDDCLGFVAIALLKKLALSKIKQGDT